MPSAFLRFMQAACIFYALVLLGGCASNSNAVDPWEKSNRFFYKLDDGMDRYALKPLADGYVKVVPQPIRTGLGNGFDNLGYFNVILNDFLQGKCDQGWSDAGRMAVNSTIGIAGFFDVATGWHMPSHENDFGITLGKWGCKNGPYMVLPLFGPSTVRDAPGIGVGFLTDPTTWLGLEWYVSIPLYTVEAMDTRSRAAKGMRFRDAAALDPYVFTRNAYLQYREGLLRGSTTQPAKSIYDEDAEPSTQPATGPATQPALTPGIH